ncbi:MAG: hypothetical protein ACR2IE_05830 [Candidatus Sumerlaeaceae bacterium]
MDIFRRAKWRPYAVGGVITLAWLVMMASLLTRHVLPQKRTPLDESAIEDPAVLTHRWRDMREYMLLMYGKAILGAASTVVYRLEGPRVHYVANFRLGATLGFAKLRQTITIKAIGELDSQFELKGFFVDANLATLRLRVRGATRGTELFLDVEKNGHHALSRLQLGRRISLLEAVRPALMQKFVIRPGAVYVLPVADPMFSMQHGQVEIRILDREKLTVSGRDLMGYKVEMRLNDFISYCWVDRHGNTLRRQIVGNLTMERADEVEAKKVSGVLSEPLELPALDLGQFTRVRSQTIDQMSDGKQSPLAVLGGLMKPE